MWWKSVKYIHFKVFEYLAYMHITEGRNKFNLRLKPFLLIMIRVNLAINFRLTKTNKLFIVGI